MKQKFAKCLMAVLMFLAAGCAGELGTADRNPSEELATVKLSVGLDGVTGTRAADGILGSEDYTTPHEISDGTHATTLIYALYKKEKEDENGVRERTLLVKDAIEGVEFPYKDQLEFQLVKGFEYTLVFWAQSPGAEKYYNTSNFENITVNYAYENALAANNDELRDAFCAKHTIILTQDVEDVNIILKRPFAQINVGMTKKAWDALNMTNKTITKSSIQLSGICNTFNLLEDNVVYDDNHPLVNGVTFAAATIPQDDEDYNTTKYLQVDLNRDGKINPWPKDDSESSDTIEEFIWLSMCYVLVPGYTTKETDDGSTTEYSTLIDMKELTLYCKEATGGENDATFSLGSVTNLPALRNHRTNLILDEWPIVTKTITVDLCPKYNGDYNRPGQENENTGHPDHIGANEAN